MTQTLHILAPDSEIRRWTSDPDRFHNNRPTRKARLLYICRPVTVGVLSEYISTEIKSVIALVDTLEEGTHGIDIEFSPLQLRLIFNRIESALAV